MTPAKALELALSKETQSISLYQRLANTHSEIRELLTQLLIEEEKHKKLIEKKLLN